MPDTDGRLIKFVTGTFLAGLVTLVLAEIWRSSDDPQWLGTVHDVLRDLGFAFIVAAVVAVIFERLLSRERDRHLKKLIRSYQEMEDFGFRQIFTNRQQVFNELLSESLRRADHVRIIGICISLFREFERVYERTAPESPVDYFANLILRGQRVQVLMLKRHPTTDELNAYGLESGDFYYMRERDEDKDDSFTGGKRLRRIANLAVGQWIEVLIRLAERTSTMNEDARREVLHRLELREYLALPSLSLYIVDDQIFVTPYLYKRHCSSVPALLVGGRQSPLYREYAAHFSETWGNPVTTTVVPYKFVDLLVQKPKETIEAFRERLGRIQREDEERCRSNRDYREEPELHRVRERALNAMLSGDGAS